MSVASFLKILVNHLKEGGIIVLKDGIITNKYKEDTQAGAKFYHVEKYEQFFRQAKLKIKY